MEFQCKKCSKVFRPHPFIGVRHPGSAKCPDCGETGNKMTEKGKKESRSRRANYGPNPFDTQLR